MEETKEHLEEQKPKRSPWDSRIVKSFVVGVALTLLSLIIVGFNLSTGGTINANDDVNRYFDTCVGEGFIESTPRIGVTERGFPLSYTSKLRVPICENGVELKHTNSTLLNFGALGANILFWTCLVFWILRKYTLRKALKVNRGA